MQLLDQSRRHETRGLGVEPVHEERHPAQRNDERLEAAYRQTVDQLAHNRARFWRGCGALDLGPQFIVHGAPVNTAERGIPILVSDG